MEQFIVSARKYRPQTFEDVVGQEAITRTLSNAIASNHLAQALLFTGPRGVGKTTCARILAKKINQQASEGTIEDEDFAFNIFELDAASNNSVDDIRELTDQVRIPPQVGKYKVYIVDEVHMLSSAAFNAFLKTLEEPPKHVIFILATTEKHKIIPTILSRCQIFDFKRITVSDAKNYLAKIAQKEGVEAEDDALHIIAQKADGAMRDALSIYDRVVSFSGKNLTRQAVAENLNVLDYDVFFEATDMILANDIPNLLVQFNLTLSKGFDGQHFIAGLASHFRDLLVCQSSETIPLLEVGDTTKKRYFEQSKKATQPFLLKAIDFANTCDFNYRNSQNQRLHVELCLMQLASLNFDPKKKSEPGFIIPAEKYPEGAVRENPTTSSQVQEETPTQKKVLPAAKQDIENNKPKEISTPSDTSLPKKKNTSEAIPPSTPQQNPVETKIEKTTTPQEERPEKQEPLPEPAPLKEMAKGTDASETETVAPTQKDLSTEQPTVSSEEKAESVSPTKVSGLSLKSISAKRAHKEKQEKLEKKITKHEAHEKFTETQFLAAWDTYTKKLKKKGRKILASILATDTPKLEGTRIKLELPNETMKKEIEQSQGSLMAFLKKELRNTDLSLEIKVNQQKIKKYAFTPIEKYNKLREKNPLIDKLRSTFDLDV